MLRGSLSARRAWAVAALATLALFLALGPLPQVVPGERWIGDAWDWSGPLLRLEAALLYPRLRQRTGSVLLPIVAPTRGISASVQRPCDRLAVHAPQGHPVKQVAAMPPPQAGPGAGLDTMVFR